MTKRNLLVLAVVVGGCNSTSTSKLSPGSDAATVSGGGHGSGGVAGAGGTSGSGGTSSSGGGPDLVVGSGGGPGTGGRAIGSGGVSSGGAGSGGEAGDARLDFPPDATGDVGADTGAYTKPVAVPDGGTCPYTGHVSYTLTKSANPTTDEQNAYNLITAAMDQAISYYNCYTNITKADNVVYDSTVATADGNSNGTIRFGSDTSYMILRVAMHEISHTVGIGTASKWRSFVAIPDGGSSGPWTGANGIAQRQALLPDVWQQQGQEVLTADTQHFWPYGLNIASDYKSEADLLGHCAMVMAIRKDLGL